MEDRTMTYSKRDFSKDLEAQLNLGYDPERIGRWAYSMWFGHCREADAELKEIMYELAVMEEGPEFERPESELRELVKLLKGPPEKPPQTERQYQLWKNMVDAIDRYVNNETQDFHDVVSKLEAALDPSEFKDIDLISKWYDFWAPLESRRAAEGNEVNKAQAVKELLEMKEFLLGYLDTDRYDGAHIVPTRPI
jgi:hypothetical protein